jgi:hypothetical protein
MKRNNILFSDPRKKAKHLNNFLGPIGLVRKLMQKHLL